MVGVLSILPLAFCVLTLAQDGGTRQIVPEEFVKSRPTKSKSGSNQRPSYQRVTGVTGATAKKAAPAAPKNAQQIGLTVWRLRPSAKTDSGARIIVQHEAGAEEWTPERVTTETPLRMGERIRFSFESPQTGYLYVIDREQYADGSTGEPFLIFPTTRTRGGDNQVSPGRVIEIPGQDDRPNYFTMRQSRPDQTGELLTVIVTLKPIESLEIGAKELKLSNDQVKNWEKTWAAQVEKFELTGGAGKTWTKAEQEAGANATRQLTQDDPSPQTVYRIAVKPGEPILVKVGLRYAKPRATSKK